jgi:hypothetical protein
LAELLTATDVEEEDDKYLSLQLFSFFPFGDLLKSSHTLDEVHVFLQALQHTQEHKVWLNIGGVKYKASQVTLRNDPASVFQL